MTDGSDPGAPHDLGTALPQLVFTCNGLGERSWSGARWSAYTGLSDADSVGLGWLDAIHPDDRPASRLAWTRAPASGVYRVDHRIRRADDGAYRWHR